MSLVQDGAVGARLIQASAHVRLGGGVLPNSSPQTLTSILCRSVVISRLLREEALHVTILSLQSFRTTHSSSSPSSLCILPCIVPRVATNLEVQSRDLTQSS